MKWRKQERLEGGLKKGGVWTQKSDPDHPLVSIITVCLNSAKYIEETIQSVLNQTYSNIEYIIVDGGSRDGTLGIIRRYEDRIAYWISEPDRGIYDAMNKGVSLATGELVGIINSDDWYFPDAVMMVVEAYKTHPEVDVIFGNLMLLERKEKGLIFRESKIKMDDVFKNFTFNHPTCFVSRRVYQKDRFNLRYKIAADYELMLRLYLKKSRFFYLNKCIACFRIGSVSYSYRKIIEYYQIVKRYASYKEALYVWCLDTLPYLELKINNFKVRLLKALFGGNKENPLLRFYRRWLKKRLSLPRFLSNLLHVER